MTIQHYLESKGHHCHHADLVDDLREQLSKENPKTNHPWVEATTTCHLKRLPVNSVRIGNRTHFVSVLPREPIGEPCVLGVVVESNGTYHLADGYHRMKWAMIHDLESGLFIVLN